MDVSEYYRAIRELPTADKAEGAGAEAVVHAAAARLTDESLGPWAASRVAALRKSHKGLGQDAEAAYTLLEAYYWDRQIEHNPLRGRITRILARLMKLRYPKLITVEPGKVVIASPWGADCPLVLACEDDLQRCRTFCDACIAHEFILAPDEMAILRAAAPTVRVALEEYREKPRDLCRYALLTDVIDASEPLAITDGADAG